MAFGDDLDAKLNEMLTYFFNVLYYCNYGINFYIQMVVNSIFRTELFMMLHLKTTSSEIS